MMGLVEGYWFSSHQADPRALALYLRHYSAKQYADNRPRRQFGPGCEHMVLLTADARAVWVWMRAKPEFRGAGRTRTTRGTSDGNPYLCGTGM